MPAASKGQVQIAARLPVDLHKRVKEIAEDEGRTFAKQVVHLIKLGAAGYPRNNAPARQ